MKKALLSSLLFLSMSLFSQTGETVFSFLSFPHSPHVSALGGTNISTISKDNDFALQNPALLNDAHEKQLNMNYTNYMGDINGGNAFYSQNINNKWGTWGVGMIFLNYGKFKETTPENIELGSFSANDLAFIGTYSYQLTRYWRGGITGKLIYSNLERYTSWGLGFDVGVNYYNEKINLSFSATIKNIGGMLKPYNNNYENLPWDIQLGISHKIRHAPFRLSLTAMYLNRWDMSTYRTVKNEPGQKDPFFLSLAKHFVIGVDFVPSNSFYVSLGFNPKVQSDYSFSDWSGFYGWSVGMGFQVKRFSIAASYASPHINAGKLQLGVTAKF